TTGACALAGRGRAVAAGGCAATCIARALWCALARACRATSRSAGIVLRRASGATAGALRLLALRVRAGRPTALRLATLWLRGARRGLDIGRNLTDERGHRGGGRGHRLGRRRDGGLAQHALNIRPLRG